MKDILVVAGSILFILGMIAGVYLLATMDCQTRKDLFPYGQAQNRCI